MFKSCKNGHFAKPLVRQNAQKRAILGLKFKLPKTHRKQRSKHARVVLCQNWLPKKTLYIREVTSRSAWKVAKMAILQSLRLRQKIQYGLFWGWNLNFKKKARCASIKADGFSLGRKSWKIKRNLKCYCDENTLSLILPDMNSTSPK